MSEFPITKGLLWSSTSEAPPEEELRRVARWLREDVHLGPLVPKRDAILRAADVLDLAATWRPPTDARD